LTLLELRMTLTQADPEEITRTRWHRWQSDGTAQPNTSCGHAAAHVLVGERVKHSEDACHISGTLRVISPRAQRVYNLCPAPDDLESITDFHRLEEQWTLP
jgi:hypothetical protein